MDNSREPDVYTFADSQLSYRFDVRLPYREPSGLFDGAAVCLGCDNHPRNVLRTPANNKLRMEDRRGEEHIKLATEYGKGGVSDGHDATSGNRRNGRCCNRKER